jgi:hypothetical protein
LRGSPRVRELVYFQVLFRHLSGERGLIVTAGTFVGRVGALAVALGVSAAISGSAVAWADGAESGSDTSSVRSDAASAAQKVTAR